MAKGNFKTGTNFVVELIHVGYVINDNRKNGNKTRIIRASEFNAEWLS